MRSLDRLERLHLALLVPAALGCVAGVVAIETRADPADELALTIACCATGVVATVAFGALAIDSWFRRKRAQAPPRDHVAGRAVAVATGVVLGGMVGIFEAPEPFGPHIGAATVYFLLLPLALLACLPRRPAWRPFADITLLMVGVEAGAQLSLSYAKWGRLRWWEDIAGFDAAWFYFAMLLACGTFVWRLYWEDRPTADTHGAEVPPPRRAS